MYSKAIQIGILSAFALILTFTSISFAVGQGRACVNFYHKESLSLEEFAISAGDRDLIGFVFANRAKISNPVQGEVIKSVYELLQRGNDYPGFKKSSISDFLQQVLPDVLKFESISQVATIKDFLNAIKNRVSYPQIDNRDSYAYENSNVAFRSEGQIATVLRIALRASTSPDLNAVDRLYQALNSKKLLFRSMWWHSSLESARKFVDNEIILSLGGSKGLLEPVGLKEFVKNEISTSEKYRNMNFEDLTKEIVGLFGDLYREIRDFGKGKIADSNSIIYKYRKVELLLEVARKSPNVSDMEIRNLVSLSLSAIRGSPWALLRDETMGYETKENIYKLEHLLRLSLGNSWSPWYRL